MPAASFQALSLRVLIVEDNHTIATVVSDAFEVAGHRIVGLARTVEEGLALVAGCEFDVALLDVDLREQHSGPVALELRKRSIPFVVTTGSAHMMTPAHVGAPLVLKPFKIDELIKTTTRHGSRPRRHPLQILAGEA